MKRAEYETKAAAFRAMLLAEAVKPAGEQTWPEPDQWLSIEGVSTCTTPACIVYDTPFPVTLHENADGIFRGQCGECQQPVTAVPVFEEE